MTIKYAPQLYSDVQRPRKSALYHLHSFCDTELSLPASFSFNKVHFELDWEIEAALS